MEYFQNGVVMSDELDRGLELVSKLEKFERSLGDSTAITLAKHWKALDHRLRDRARSWSAPVLQELASMTTAEQMRCIAELDKGEFKTVEGAVLGEESEWQAPPEEAAADVSDAMLRTLRSAYDSIMSLRMVAAEIDNFNQRETMLHQLKRCENLLEAWSKTPKEMLLYVQAD